MKTANIAKPTGYSGIGGAEEVTVRGSLTKLVVGETTEKT
jgi:hypothetical protein